VQQDGLWVHNGCFPLSQVKSWLPKSSNTFGHSFITHGKQAYNSLIGRLETGNPQGHWLNDAKAASYLESLQDEIANLAPGQAKTFPLPDGLGEVLTKNADAIVATPATKVTVVRGSDKSRSFIRTSFPSE
jgi:hypothetical protein